MKDDLQLSWERFLNPEILRTNLIVASLYLTAFEILKENISERVKDFYSLGFSQDGPIIKEENETEVLTRNRSPLYASLSWLKDMDTIDKNDIEKFDKIKACRNELAHEITNFISKEAKLDPLPLFKDMIDLLEKIEKWWILNVETPINPDFNGKKIDKDNIIPGPIITLRVLAQIALGTAEESRFYWKEWKKKPKDI